VPIVVDPSRRLDPSNLRSLCTRHHAGREGHSWGHRRRPVQEQPPAQADREFTISEAAFAGLCGPPKRGGT
jgi:hypothetical protein